MNEANYPILEYDPSPDALIEPSRLLSPIDIPPHCVLCFFQEVIGALAERGLLRHVYLLGSEMGPNPVYVLEVDGRPLALAHPGVGAPLAAGFMDELIALGCRKFIACGGAGVLDRALVVGHVVAPTSAVRDEGVSYHYLPPSREVAPSPEAVAAIEATLAHHGVAYVTGKTWTTDGFYRETAARIARRRAEGCLTVEMEAAAFFAVGRFRGAVVGQLLYGGDDVSGDAWDSRGWQSRVSIRERLFWLAAEACLAL
jgi:nucleoside phosphorylase